MFVQKWEGAGMYLHRHVSTVSLVISPKIWHTYSTIGWSTHSCICYNLFRKP